MNQIKYILVVNPISGDVDKSEIIEKTRAFATEKSIELIVFETTQNDDAETLRRLYKLHQPKRILIVGGDGTIKFVAETFEQEDVIFGIIPAGSANGLAADLALADTVEENLEIAFNDNFIDIDMISINGKRSIHLSDLGLNAKLVKNYEKSDTRGKWGYALQIITTLRELGDPFSAQITANGTTITCEAAMIVIANSQKYGTGVMINPDGKMDDGKFEIVILKHFDFVIFTKIITGNMPENAEDIQIISTDTAIITTKSPVSFQIDGEYIGEETHLDIKILPSQMKIVIPNN
jgi:diacylglycerol kinase (ATP)